jgi:hypothetical protein
MIILLIGMCGTGKTWVMEQLIQYYVLSHRKKLGKIYYHTDNRIIAVGKYDGSMYQGSDKLSMSVMTDVDAFIQNSKRKIIIAEGDRFTNGKFIAKANPIIIKITDDGLVGRMIRGSKQSDRHLKSIQTRVNNIEPNHEVINSTEALELIKNLIENNYGK